MLHIVENLHAAAHLGDFVAFVTHLIPAHLGVEFGIDGIEEVDDGALAVEIDDPAS